MICISTVALVLIWLEKWLQNVYLLKTPSLEQIMKQECIPVGCLPPAAVAVSRGGLPEYMLGHPQVWVWRPPWVWAWRPPRPDPSTSALGVGLETPPGQTPEVPPWVWAWRPARHAGIPLPGDLQGMLGYHPPWTEFLKHTSENITLPQLRCGR